MTVLFTCSVGQLPRPRGVTKHHPPIDAPHPPPGPCTSPRASAEDENRDGDCGNSMRGQEKGLGKGQGLGKGKGLGLEEKEEEEEGDDDDGAVPNNDDHCHEASSSSLLPSPPRQAQGQGLARRGIRPQRGGSRYYYEADDEGSVDGDTGDDDDDRGDNDDGGDSLYSSISPPAHTPTDTVMTMTMASSAGDHTLSDGLAQGQCLAQGQGLPEGQQLVDIPRTAVSPLPPLSSPILSSLGLGPLGQKRQAPGQGLTVAVKDFAHPSPFATMSV